MKTKDIALIGVVAAVYVVLTVLLSPISYGALQFRASEMLKPMALKGRQYVLALTVGLFIANLYSPFAGGLELIFMPTVCFVGGEIAYRLRNKRFIAIATYSTIISCAVALMLKILINAPYAVTAVCVFIPEIILMFIGGKVNDYIFFSS